MLVPVDKIIGARSSTDFGVNFGAGVLFEVTDEFAVFVEARFRYVWGPEIEGNAVLPDPAPAPQKANGTYFPFTFGIRF